MVKRFLMAASMAALVCHPSSAINCFKSKISSSSSQREKSSKSTNKDYLRTNSSLSRTSVSSSSNMNITSPIPNLVFSTSCKDSCLVSNLVKQEAAFGVVETIFKSGWDNKIGLQIEKILEINHNIDVLKRFEEYREIVKSKSANISPHETERIERLAVDGYELLRFYGGVVTCSLGNDEFSSICYKE